MECPVAQGEDQGDDRSDVAVHRQYRGVLCSEAAATDLDFDTVAASLDVGGYRGDVRD